MKYEERDLPKELFSFVRQEQSGDQVSETPPAGYVRDAWRRFCRNRGALFSAAVILGMILFALLAPVLLKGGGEAFFDGTYAKKPPRHLLLRDTVGIADGGSNRDFSEKGLIYALAIGVGAEDGAGGGVTLAAGMDSPYQPVLRVGEPYTVSEIRGQPPKVYYPGRIDNYLEVGFQYRSISPEEYEEILKWQEEAGLRVLYPLIGNNSFNPEPANPNYWYRSIKGVPVDEGGSPLPLSADTVLTDNYKRASDGSLVYREYIGGGTEGTDQYRVRVLYYNYYRFKNGFEPRHIFGTDSQGYDLALRLAGGLRLSLLLALVVAAINLMIGAVYGAAEGYYGGGLDLFLERLAEILGGIPFVVAATLFQIYLSGKVGAFPSLLFAFVLTGWIGTAARVRSQFYRFKGQEYVLAARTMGARDRRIIWKHIFPNAIGTIITASVLVIPATITTESVLSYLGIVKLNTAEVTSLGNLLAEASGLWTTHPHLLLFPAGALSLLLICFNLLGNGLRDAFNPALRGVED